MTPRHLSKIFGTGVQGANTPGANVADPTRCGFTLRNWYILVGLVARPLPPRRLSRRDTGRVLPQTLVLDRCVLEDCRFVGSGAVRRE